MTELLETLAKIADALDEKGDTALANKLDEIIKTAAEMGKLLDLDAFRRRKHSPKPMEGSVISGTMREEDLIPAFLGELEKYDKTKADALRSDFDILMSSDEPDAGYLSDLMLEIGDELNQKYAPEGMYFGSNYTDPADIGWWQREDGDADDKVKTTLGPKGRDIRADEEAELVKTAFIRRRGNKWCVISKKNKSLGCYTTKAQALRRLRQVEYFKRH